MFKEIVIFGALVVACTAEAPQSGPYPPSGWKPQGAPFTLPTEFLPQQQRRAPQQPNKVDVEITQERVEYAGQISDTTTNQPNPNNGYLPPEPEDAPEDATTTEDFLKVQGLPTNNQNNFRPQSQSGRLTNGQRGQINNQYVPPQAASGNYRAQNNRQFGQTRQQPLPPLFSRQVGAPANAYGPPQTQPQPQQPENENAEPNPPETDNEEEEKESDDEPENENEPPTIAVANSISNGQYYILTPDNTLQRVVFMTSQDAEEARTNGFTAQLRYMPVEPIRDPIYAYNTEGQLIRIFNKK